MFFSGDAGSKTLINLFPPISGRGALGGVDEVVLAYELIHPSQKETGVFFPERCRVSYELMLPRPEVGGGLP